MNESPFEPRKVTLSDGAHTILCCKKCDAILGPESERSGSCVICNYFGAPQEWHLPPIFSEWATRNLCGICRQPKLVLAVSCAQCAAEGQQIWDRATAKLGRRECTLSELIAALKSLGYSEGAIDGAIEQIEVSGRVEMTEDMDYREARS